MSEMILGYKKLKDCSPGSLIRLQDGTYLILSEYGNDDGVYSAYLSGSGENFAMRNPDEWIAIIDLDWFDMNLEEYLDYPVIAPQQRGNAQSADTGGDDLPSSE